MAIYISIRKTSETPLYAEYSYATAEEPFGLLQIDKLSGEIRLVHPLPGDIEQASFQRAARKVTQHWQKGELPDFTCWAS